MTEKRIKFSLLLIMLCFLTFNSIGVNWGVPKKETTMLIFSNQELVRSLIPEMKKAREAIREMIVFAGDEYSAQYDEKKLVISETGDHKFSVSTSTLNAMRTYLLRTYYPDEHMIMIAFSNMNMRKWDFNPKIFTYGGSYVYPMGLWFGILHVLRIINVTPDLEYYLNSPDEIGKIYIWGRIFGILATLAATFFLYLAGKKFLKSPFSLIAVFLFSITPLLVVRNHYLAPYPVTLLYGILAFYFSLKLTEDNKTNNYCLAGLFSGLAAGAIFIYAFSSVFFIIGGGVYYFYNRNKVSFSNVFKKIILGIGIMVGIFFVFNCYILVTWQEFLKEMQFDKGLFSHELREFRSLYYPVSPWLYYFIGTLKSGFGLPLLLTILAGFPIIFLKKRNKETIFLATVVLIMTAFLGFSSPWFVRRSVFLIPFFALLGGVSCEYFFSNRSKFIGWCILIIVAGYTLLYSLSYAGLFCTRNIRNEAGEWINSNIPEKSKIGLTQMPAPYRTPPFAFYRYNLMPVGWEKQIMGKEKPEYFVLSEYDTRYIKEGYQNTFFQDYELIKKFEKQPEILGIKFKKGRFSAKDWWEPNPVIWIYKRKYVER